MQKYKSDRWKETNFVCETTNIQPKSLDQITGNSLPKATYDCYLSNYKNDIDDEAFLKNNDPYIIKQQLGLEYVLESEETGCYHADAAVFVHMYYTDLMEECFNYIREACMACDVYVSTSVKTIAEYIESACRDNHIKNCRVTIIDNRGRDIAALLLCHAKIMKQYRYVCFVHDKKSSTSIEPKTGIFWFKVLWDNTVASSGYITNVIKQFEKDDRLGMLSVPEPFWGDLLNSVENGWSFSLDATAALAKRLNLTCKPEKHYPPIAIGTAFWARTDALRTLFDAPFTIEEFPPNTVDSLSYAVERIFPYVVQSRGYYTGIVETKNFSNFKLIYLQNLVMRTASLLRRRFSIYSEMALDEYQIFYDKIDAFLDSFSQVYVYGTGKKAAQLIHLYPNLLNLVDGFVETTPERSKPFFCDKKILSAKSVIQKETGFILAMAEIKAKEVFDYLLKNGVTSSQVLVLSSLSEFTRLD